MEVVVTEKERIDKYLSKNTDMSRSLIAKMIKSGFILVNGEEIKINYITKLNDVIEIDETFKVESDI